MNNTRFIPMQCGDNESYALLFYEKTAPSDVSEDDAEAYNYAYVDIYDMGTKQVVQTLQTPFPKTAINEIRYTQSFDVMFFAQGDTRPCKLVRDEAEDGNGYVFSFEECEIYTEPLLDWDMKSEHSIHVFPLPDEDIANYDEDGNMRSFPIGAVRKDAQAETLTVAFSYATITIPNKKKDFHGNTPDSGVYYTKGYVYVYAFAETIYAQKYQVGQVVVFDTMLKVNVNTSAYVDNVRGAESYDGAALISHTNNSASFSSARVSAISNQKITFYCGRVTYAFAFLKVGYTPKYGRLTVSGVTTTTTTGKYGEPRLYKTISEDTPLEASLTNTVYYTPLCGVGYKLAMTIDGGNSSESLVVGQIIALKRANTLYHSELWDYESYPVGTFEEAMPPVDLLDVLDSKTDKNGNELRPATGGGYGFASAWFPVRGTVELKTNGVWSGVIELQEMDENGNVDTIAKISSENGLSNTTLERDITEFGSSVRVACTRREKAYERYAAVDSSGNLNYTVRCVDDGCNWTLSSSDVQTVFFRIEEKKTLSDGTNAYVALCYGGVTDEFSTNSYALGAWSTKNGYPQHVGIFQERMVYACNKQKPSTFWFSKTNDWEDFEEGTLDTSPMNFTMNTEKYDSIRWMLAQKSYISIGTDYGEWIFGEANGGVASPTTGRFLKTSSIGNCDICAQDIGSALIMVKTGQKELHRIDYNSLSEEGAGTQVSMLARHLFEDDKVLDMFVVRSPTNTLYCVTESGKLISFTYEPEYNVAGWARHEVLDGVVCAGCVRRSGTDVLVMVVKSGDSYLLGEIDPTADVWTDDGQEYESYLKPTPLAISSVNGAYGGRAVIAGCDIYTTKATQYFAKLPQGNWTRIDEGFDVSGNLNEFSEHKTTLPAPAGWADEATVEIKTSYPAPLVVSAIGASVKTGG